MATFLLICVVVALGYVGLKLAAWVMEHISQIAVVALAIVGSVILLNHLHLISVHF